MSDSPEEIKTKIAQQSAKLFLTQMVAVPGDVQLMAIGMLAQTVFITAIKEQNRLALLDQWLQSIRDEVKRATNPKKAKRNGR